MAKQLDVPLAEAQPEPQQAVLNEETVDDLTKQKLRAEIANLTKPFYRRIEFWQFISTFSIAILTYLILWFNGAFDAKAKYLEMQKEGLIKDIERFKQDTIGYTKQKDSLHGEIELYRKIASADSAEGVELRKRDRAIMNMLDGIELLDDSLMNEKKRKNSKR